MCRQGLSRSCDIALCLFQVLARRQCRNGTICGGCGDLPDLLAAAVSRDKYAPFICRAVLVRIDIAARIQRHRFRKDLILRHKTDCYEQPVQRQFLNLTVIHLSDTDAGQFLAANSSDTTRPVSTVTFSRARS